MMRSTQIGVAVRVDGERIGKVTQRRHRDGILVFTVRTDTGLTEVPADRLERPCSRRRCDNGTYPMAHGMGVCAVCNGTAWVALAEVQQERAARRAEDARARQILNEAIRDRTGSRASQLEDDVRSAIDLLERESRDRVRKMHTSILAGRVDDVITHLLAYLKANRPGVEEVR